MKAMIAAAILQLFAAHHVEGDIAIRDVMTGEMIVAPQEDSAVLPLSTVKLALAAEAGRSNVKTQVDLHALIVHGSDDDGRTLALDLRRALGSAAVLDALRRDGFEITLPADASDKIWSDALSLGEDGIAVKLADLTRFLRGLGLSKTVADGALELAMRDCVADGTAKGSDAVLPSGWRMGGKTGTGPATILPLTDGIFAGLIFDARGRARYAVVTYVRNGGRGGGVAAGISAEAAKLVIEGK